ncbi:putative protease Do-like 14 [Rutidosis leptorrhynchoides]|uniref:putative protease Do-like 14 n=1 Tax=Rutidosis leptorrhynchoides TaxID=125765 RepID=UPI003A99A71D
MSRQTLTNACNRAFVSDFDWGVGQCETQEGGGSEVRWRSLIGNGRCLFRWTSSNATKNGNGNTAIRLLSGVFGVPDRLQRGCSGGDTNGLMKVNAGICNPKSISRMIALAVAGGAGWLYSNSSADFSVQLYPNFTNKLHPILSRMDSAASNGSNKDSSGKVGGGSKSIADAAADVLPALVYITLNKNRGKDVLTIAGSGTIIDPNGTILTCAHLFSNYDGLEVALNGTVNVTLQDGRSFVGTILNTDIHYDVALVKIDGATPFSAAKLGSSSKLRPGDSVLALGSPLGLKNTVTAGIVSCVNRASCDIGSGGMLRQYIQTDCATYHGSSGGPLVNLYGEVIGVNTGGYDRSGYNFAVPIDPILKIMEQFKKNGTVIRPWLGMKMVDLDEICISQLKNGNPKFPRVKKGVLVVMEY